MKRKSILSIAAAALALCLLAYLVFSAETPVRNGFEDFGEILVNLPSDRTVPQQFYLTGQGNTAWFHEGYAMAFTRGLDGRMLWEGTADAIDHFSETGVTDFSALIDVDDYTGIADIVIMGYNAEDDGRGDPVYSVRVIFAREE